MEINKQKTDNKENTRQREKTVPLRIVNIDFYRTEEDENNVFSSLTRIYLTHFVSFLGIHDTIIKTCTQGKKKIHPCRTIRSVYQAQKYGPYYP
jgi:hypothetical protein